jgi:hypothetical protein
MEIDDNEFNKNMRRLDQRFDEILKLLKAKNRLNGEAILDNQDVCMMFKLAPRSLQRYRSSGELPYMRIGSKPFYYESEVRRFIMAKRQNKPPGEDADDE